MADSGHRRKTQGQCRRESEGRGFRRSWCCSFGISPDGPENLSDSHTKTPLKSDVLSKSGAGSFLTSPQSSNRTGLGLVGRIDPRRILSPGRVSPIDSDTSSHTCSVSDVGTQLGSPDKLTIPGGAEAGASSAAPPAPSFSSSALKNHVAKDQGSFCGVFDVRLSLKGKNGICLVLELDSEVLSAHSSVFAELISDSRKGSGGSSAANLCRIEVPDVANLGIFQQTIQLMFEEDISRRLIKVGVSRSIDILEVSVGIMFTKGVCSCLKYLEAVPWTENEEEKLKVLFTRFTFDDATARDVLARLYSPHVNNSQQYLAMQMVWSITSGANANARSDLKFLVKGLLSKSSNYDKDSISLDKEDIYVVFQSCLGSLLRLFEEACDSVTEERLTEKDMGRPLVQRISNQVDNINWLLEILLDRQMAEDFVSTWADQIQLVRMHDKASPIVRYELSRISACIFIALGRGKLHCQSEVRCRVLQVWFGPMLVDFGWLQRCRKGLDMNELEEAMGHALLTLPLKQQHSLFMEWLRCFSSYGTECPNLSIAFQIWWRRALRAPETRTNKSRA
ncbi:BTB/POZ domain-containing protein At2g13690-like [Macadamia integrifolia]|uniref:BTB/POZ domain-containing protein At2g13690-like n=1 Tax=Macadamia integrifolia TaxID=60698 RepID=UPI001C4FB447|nr:BTB/POZ domain-containing protein At2g13690-like [Macadamia integrifolia]